MRRGGEDRGNEGISRTKKALTARKRNEKPDLGGPMMPAHTKRAGEKLVLPQRRRQGNEKGCGKMQIPISKTKPGAVTSSTCNCKPPSRGVGIEGRRVDTGNEDLYVRWILDHTPM